MCWVEKVGVGEGEQGGKGVTLIREGGLVRKEAVGGDMWMKLLGWRCGGGKESVGEGEQA